MANPGKPSDNTEKTAAKKIKPTKKDPETVVAPIKRESDTIKQKPDTIRQKPDMVKKEKLATIEQKSAIGKPEPGIVKDICYATGKVSRDAIVLAKKAARSDVYKKLGKSLNSFQKGVQEGWKSPDKVFAKDGVSTDGKPAGLVLGSLVKYGVDQLYAASIGTARVLTKGYKSGRKGLVSIMWKSEHPEATKLEKEAAEKKIEDLFKV